jgi:hypothetical protein
MCARAMCQGGRVAKQADTLSAFSKCLLESYESIDAKVDLSSYTILPHRHPLVLRHKPHLLPHPLASIPPCLHLPLQ